MKARTLRLFVVAITAVWAAVHAEAQTADPEISAIRPISGPSSGGTAVSIFGTNFATGATVTVGDASATGVTLIDPTQIDALTPALTPGSVNDVVISVPGQGAVTLDGAFFAQFNDVPSTHQFAAAIAKMRRKGITTGCGGGNYCPGDAVTRGQMAVFILRGKHGSNYRPPPATGAVFDDVPATALFADWIEQFASEGITTGCGGKRYCPNQQVTRGEMAVFILRARHGSTHSPPPAIGFFGDVTTTTPFAKWIEEFAGEGITTGCGGGNYCPTGPSTRGEMAVFLTKAFAKNVQQEIAFDLAAGTIDYESSLLDRFYALFRDDRLPTRYQSAPTSAEDPGLFVDAERALPDLSPEGQAIVESFLAPPDDPSSPFGPAAPASSEAGRRLATGTQCPQQWASVASSHFRVHLCPTVEPEQDQDLLSKVSAMADSLWTPMTQDPPAGMGEPLDDCFTPESGGEEVCLGGDAKIDVYLVATNQCRAREGHCWAIEGDDLAEAISSARYVGKKSSGYMLLSRSRAGDISIKSDFAHEFFHVLQDAHNRFTAYTTKVNGHEETFQNWFIEASATWAEWEYVPETAAAQVHTRFSEDFQPSRGSLLTNNPDLHPYASYIWGFFAQQENGGVQPIFQAWVAIEGAGTIAAVTDAVDQQLSFETHFRDFAVRNWNQDLPGQPIKPLYKDLPPSAGAVPFPSSSPPFVNVMTVTATSAKQTRSYKIDALAAQYDQINVQSGVKKVVIRFKNAPAGIDVDLLVKKTNPEKWERRKVDKAKGAGICVDKEKVERIIVILSNHEKKKDSFLKGTYQVEKRASCCTELGEATSITANVSFNYAHDGDVYGTAIHANESAALTAKLTPVPPAGLDIITFASSAPTGTGTIHDREDFDGGDSTAIDGSGPPQSGSGISLAIDLTNCTCQFDAGAYIDVNVTPPGGPGGQAAVGAVGATGMDIGGYADQIDGSGSFDAHSSGGPSGSSVQKYIPGGLGILYFINPANENTGGAAGVNWSFSPTFPAASSSAKEEE